MCVCVCVCVCIYLYIYVCAVLHKKVSRESKTKLRNTWPDIRNKFLLNTCHCSTILYQGGVKKWALNYLMNYHYKPNSWTLIKVLKDK